jgi:hypothetical protein
MRSTRLADRFYKWDINPFYLVAFGVFLYPVMVYLLSFLLLTLSYLHSFLVTVVVFGLSTLVFYLWFHRNPPRQIKRDESMILSPADGTVVYVRRIKENQMIISEKKKNAIALPELVDI